METQYVQCLNCKSNNVANSGLCHSCGSRLPIAPQPMMTMPGPSGKIPGSEKKLAAGICGILLGGLGIHKFVLGYKTEGIIMLAAYLIGLFVCGLPALAMSVIGIIEGIMYLTKSDEEFVQTYITNKKPWF